jgi:hypothetical protein
MDDNMKTTDANRDPISGTPGAHPLGVGAGAAGGGVAGAAVGSVVGGPVGAVVGGAIGAVAGGLAGKGAAEAVNPTAEDAYWRGAFKTRPYIAGEPYDTYQPAYRYGWESQRRYSGRSFDAMEPELAGNWEKTPHAKNLSWEKAKHATRDAWHRVERILPGDADGDGI